MGGLLVAALRDWPASTVENGMNSQTGDHDKSARIVNHRRILEKWECLELLMPTGMPSATVEER